MTIGEFKMKYGTFGASMVLRTIAQRMAQLSPEEMKAAGLSPEVIAEQTKIAEDLEAALAGGSR